MCVGSDDGTARREGGTSIRDKQVEMRRHCLCVRDTMIQFFRGGYGFGACKGGAAHGLVRGYQGYRLGGFHRVGQGPDIGWGQGLPNG